MYSCLRHRLQGEPTPFINVQLSAAQTVAEADTLLAIYSSLRRRLLGEPTPFSNAYVQLSAAQIIGGADTFWHYILDYLFSFFLPSQDAQVLRTVSRDQQYDNAQLFGCIVQYCIVYYHCLMFHEYSMVQNIEKPKKLVYSIFGFYQRFKKSSFLEALPNLIASTG